MLPTSSKRTIWCLGFGLLFSLVASAASETRYVQAAKTALRDTPRIDGKALRDLKRGDVVEVQEAKGLWLRVKTGGEKNQEGWISKLFLSQHRPVGAAELSESVDPNLERASRRRPSSYAVSAATRGLLAGERAREGRELYRTDFEALEEIESMQVKTEQIEAFARPLKRK